MGEVEEKLKDYEIKREGEAEILMLQSNAVFFNPVQGVSCYAALYSYGGKLRQVGAGVIKNGNQDNDDEDDVPKISKWEAIAWLAILTAWIAVLSAYLVDAIKGASKAWNIPIAFISAVLLPIVGNAAEHASAVMFAMKDKLDISLGVAIGSSTQISMFVIPFCVVMGWMMGQPMDLNFHLFETSSLLLTVLLGEF